MRIAAGKPPRAADFASYHPVYDTQPPVYEDEAFTQQILSSFAKEGRFATERAQDLLELGKAEPIVDTLRELATRLVASTLPPDDWNSKWESDFEPSNATEARVFSLLNASDVNECYSLLVNNKMGCDGAVFKGIEKWFRKAQYQAAT
eukprot:Protomagalhaensia_wolfi_Nauph_80__3167@NODE_3220_length_853_cov_5_431204_g2520_i0_p1_GENE_NODE_3220_length_853_cov_5_431204_g2520_i0NODE_3220_length_853_cov_5_431204_g2520_i0_p1_ORF_typecomplete_len148_score20_95Orbi_VP3/PF01700_16/0_029DDE_Tnp_1_assoc/PF13808_6/1_7e02DDE_Tnp_1_assoc/PF13808_6/3_6DDE_Tnp_1_assoc/PF13808_6/3_3e03PXA/PF02194_15/0_18_NODE_3220_length_853_cov_5_431204_g2520_i0242685